MSARKGFTAEEAQRAGEQIGIDWRSAAFNVEQFRQGMEVELEHGLHDGTTNVTSDDPISTAKIALAHLNEFPDYYTRLQRMEREAEQGVPTGDTTGGLADEFLPAFDISDEVEKVTQDQALARIESVDGIPTIEGVAVPSYVVGDKDRARWSHAQRWARDSSGLPATDPLVQAMTRELFHNPAYAD